MGFASKTLMIIAWLTLWAAPDAAFAQFGNRLRQMAAPPPNAGGYAFYTGDLHFEHGIDPVCTALTNGVYKVYFAARSGPGGVEAYMFGEKIMHAYIRGSDRNHLSVTHLGDAAPSGSMHLLPLGTGFLGTVQSKTISGRAVDRGRNGNWPGSLEKIQAPSHPDIRRRGGGAARNNLHRFALARRRGGDPHADRRKNGGGISGPG